MHGLPPTLGLGPCTPTRVRKKVADSTPAAQHSLPGQLTGLGLLGVHRQESMVDSLCHIQRHFQAMQYTAWQI